MGPPGLIIGSRLLVRNTVDRTLVGADRRTGHRLDHLTGALGIGDPLGIEIVGAGRNALRAVTGVDHAGVAAMQQLEEVVLRLAIAAGVAGQKFWSRGVLYTALLLPGLAP